MGFGDFLKFYKGSVEIVAAYRGETQVFGDDVPAPSAPTNTVAPSITGTATVGQTLTAAVGTWTGSPSYARQWLRNGTAISGATGTTYLLIAADEAASISVRITATNAGGSAQATSAGVGPVAAAPTAPSQITSWTWTTGLAASQIALAITAPSDGGSAITGYEYSLDGGATAIPLTGASPWTLTMAAAGTSYTAVVRARNAIGAGAWSTSKTATTAATVVAPTNTVLPAITGTTTVGQTLTASTGTWTGLPTGYAYQWLRAGSAISGATGSTYALAAADEGSLISVTVTSTNAGGSAEATSAGVGPVEAGGAVDPLTMPFTSSRLAVIGDSQVASAYNINSTIYDYYGIGTSEWGYRLARKLSNRVTFAYGAGVAGQNTAEMAAGANTTSAAAQGKGCSILLFVGGTNDGEANSSVAATIANYRTIFDAYTARGFRIVTWVLPQKDYGPDLSAHVMRRQWLSDPQRIVDYPGFTYVNVYDDLTTASGYGLKTGYSDDGLHLNAAGSEALASVLADRLGPLWPIEAFPSQPTAVVSEANSLGGAYAFGATTGGTITNNSDAVVTGTLPTGCSLTIPNTYSGEGWTFDFSVETNTDGDAELIVHAAGNLSEARPASVGGRGFTLTFPSVSNAVAALIGNNGVVVQNLRAKLDQGTRGLRRIITSQRLTSSTQSTRYSQWGGLASPAPLTVENEYYDRLTATQAYDSGNIQTPALVSASNWTSHSGRWIERSVQFVVADTGPVEFTARLSRLGNFAAPRNP